VEEGVELVFDGDVFEGVEAFVGVWWVREGRWGGREGERVKWACAHTSEMRSTESGICSG